MAKKRANGEGNIRKRSDGRWEGRYTAGYHPDTGKRIIKNVLGRTQAEVKAKLKNRTRALSPIRSSVSSLERSPAFSFFMSRRMARTVDTRRHTHTGSMILAMVGVNTYG